MMNKHIWIGLLAITGIFGCTTQKVVMTDPVIDPEISKVIETVDVNTIKKHIYFLASDEMAGRDTPSDELNIAARYLATALMGYGVPPVPGKTGYFQEVPMKEITPPTSGTISVGEYTFSLAEDFLLINGKNTEFEEEIVFLNYGTEADFKAIPVKGKLVVTIAGMEGESNPQQWFYAGRNKQAMAAEMGAAGMIEIYNSPQLPWNFLVQFLNAPRTMVDDNEKGSSDMPYMWVNASNPTAIAALKAGKGAKGKVKIAGLIERNLSTYNVVGMVEGTDPVLKDEYVIYSAHYDHVGIGTPDAKGDSIYNGARDNAVGSVTVLSAAENIAKYPTKRSALFIFFTGEEKGLLGSAYYTDHPLLPLNKAVYCFNSDNAGYNDTSRVSIIGLTRTGAQPLIEKAVSTFGLTAMEDAAPEENLFDRSDNVNFAAKGVPAPTFSLGFTAFDDEIGKYYHQAADGPETLDYNYLEKFFKSYVYACRLIGNTNQSVFWNEGDKYYESGKELYGK